MGNKKGRKYSSREIWGYHRDTPSELKIAKNLRKAGVCFEREVPIKQFKVDFLIDDWLVIEVDGWSHLTSSRKKEDRRRQSILENCGYSVLRIPTSEISYEAGLKQWIGKIISVSKRGPKSFAQPGFENFRFKKQVKEVQRKLRVQARKAGLSEQNRKRQMARFTTDDYRENKSQLSREPRESMEDYFGQEAEDFAKLLEDYDWDNVPDKDRHG